MCIILLDVKLMHQSRAQTVPNCQVCTKILAIYFKDEWQIHVEQMHERSCIPNNDAKDIILNDTQSRNQTNDRNETHNRNFANDRNYPNDGNETNQTNDANVFTCRSKR